MTNTAYLEWTGKLDSQVLKREKKQKLFKVLSD